MRYRLLGEKEIDRVQWGQLLEHSPGSTVYHTAEWAELWSSSFPYFRAAFAVVQDDGRYLAGLPLVLRGCYPLIRIYSMPMGGYGGLLVRSDAPGRAEDYFGGLKKIVDRLRPCFWQMVDFENRMGFLVKHRFSRDVVVTQLVDLEAYRGISRQRTKRGAVQSSRRGVEVVDLEDEEQLESGYRLLGFRDESYGQRTKYPYRFFQGLWRNLAPRGLARMAVARHQGKTIGFIVDLFYRDTAIYWDGASHPEFRSLRPADALIQATIGWGLSKGMRWLNLGASPPGAQGLERFKKSWGGQVREYYVFTRQAPWFGIFRRLKA